MRSGCIYLGSFYRPTGGNATSVDNLEASVHKVIRKHRKLPNIILAGDANLPDIDWETVCTTNPRTQSLHNKFLDILSNYSLLQFTRDITRPSSGTILNLICASSPALGEKVIVSKGISDHDVMIFDVNNVSKTTKETTTCCVSLQQG